MNVKQKFSDYCARHKIPFQDIDSVRPYDNTTLFCPAGMQKFKGEFAEPLSVGTRATCQHCIRVDDLGQVGDGTHYSDFHMLGLFSFRQWTVEKAVRFWLGFMDELGINIDEAHVHPERKEWKSFYPDHVNVMLDSDCQWSDGEIGGYCTEFYVNGVEVGNIVNPLGNCIDVGFGLERLEALVNGPDTRSKDELIISTVRAIANAGYVPGKKQQGYVLRKLLKSLRNYKGLADVPYLEQEIERHRKILENYARLKGKHPDKPPEWWLDTHGVDLGEIDN